MGVGPVEMKGGTESEKDISGYCLCSRLSFNCLCVVVGFGNALSKP